MGKHWRKYCSRTFGLHYRLWRVWVSYSRKEVGKKKKKVKISSGKKKQWEEIYWRRPWSLRINCRQYREKAFNGTVWYDGVNQTNTCKRGGKSWPRSFFRWPRRCRGYGDIKTCWIQQFSHLQQTERPDEQSKPDVKNNLRSGRVFLKTEEVGDWDRLNAAHQRNSGGEKQQSKRTAQTFSRAFSYNDPNKLNTGKNKSEQSKLYP